MESRVHRTGNIGHQPIGRTDGEIVGLDKISEVIGGLRNWSDPFALASWVEKEADGLNYAAVMAGMFEPKAESDTRILLCVLGYSYAIGIYSSEEIVRNCRTNEAFAALSGGKFLLRQELKWFRCRNRPMLNELLGRVFVRAVCEWYGLG